MNNDNTNTNHNGQTSAINIEHILIHLTNCKRGWLLGVIDSDIIRQNPELSLTSTLSYLYETAEIENNTN